MRLMKYVKEREGVMLRCLHGAKRSLVGGDLICTSVLSREHEGIWYKGWRASGEDQLSSWTKQKVMEKEVEMLGMEEEI